MARFRAAPWIGIAAAAAVALVVLVLGHPTGRSGEAEIPPPAGREHSQSARPDRNTGRVEGSAAIEGVVAFPPGTRLSGRVTASPVWPIDSLSRSSGGVTAEIQPDGSFRVGPLESRIYALEVDADGFAPLRVEEAHPGESLTVTLEAGIAIAGTVRTLEGVPVPRAAVWALYPPPYAGRRLTTADAEGRFLIRGMPPGVVRLIAEVEHFATGTAAIEVPEEPPAGEESVGCTLSVGRGTDLVGLVRSRETGAPLAGATVLAWKIPPVPAAAAAAADAADVAGVNESLLLARTQTGPDGFFRLLKLPAGRVSGWITARGQAPAPFDVPLSEEWRVERADLDLQAAGRATVRLISEKGDPEIDVDVEAVAKAERDAQAPEPPLPREMRAALRSRTDALGRCSFDGLRADRYVYFTLPRPEGRLPLYSSESFWPAPGKLHAAGDYRVRRGGSALARFVLAGGQGAAWSRVTAAGRQFLADASGVVRIDGIDESGATLEVDHPDGAPFTATLALEGAKERSGLHYRLENGSALTGRIVQSGSGEPIQGATVVVGGTEPFAWSRRARTNEEGAFTVIGLGRAPWTVEVRAPGCEPMRDQVVSAPPAPITLTLRRRLRS